MEDPNQYEEIILNSNKAAIQLIKISDYKSAKSYLDTSLKILSSKSLQNSNKLLGITLNNYGYFYKQQGHLEKSLKYFKKSIEASTLAGSSVSQTYLNISNVLSKSSKHDEALEAAFHSLKSLGSFRKNQKLAALALKTMGEEYSFLNMPAEAKRMFQKAENISNRNFNISESKESSAVRTGSSYKTTPRLNFFQTESRPRVVSRTPDLESTDRIFIDFIPAPVNFENLVKIASPENRGKRKVRILRKINPIYTMNKGKDRRKLGILTPAPKKTKLGFRAKKSYSPLL